MQMTDREIVKEYIEARYKTVQVGILADLNCTDRNTIIQILRDNGITYPPKKGAKTKGEQEAYEKIMQEESQMAVIKRPIKNDKKCEDPKAAAGYVPDIVLQMVNEKIGEMQEELEAIIAHEKELNGKLAELKEFVKRYE